MAGTDHPQVARARQHTRQGASSSFSRAMTVPRVGGARPPGLPGDLALLAVTQALKVLSGRVADPDPKPSLPAPDYHTGAG